MYPKHLEQLRKQLKDKNLSLLVGAGYSKNVDNKLFPSWWQLLVKMVFRMNKNIYESTFEKLTGKKSSDAPEDYDNYTKKEIDLYIEQTGYLAVVSNYIKKIGYRETVDAYIEENTPLAIRNGTKIQLKVKGEKGIPTYVPIDDHKLIFHSKLIKLPWNNIYTTNYDNLLEICIDEDLLHKLKLRKDEIESNIRQLTNDILKQKRELEISEEKSQHNLTHPDETFSTLLSPNKFTSAKQKNESKLKEIKLKKTKLEYEITIKSNQLDDNLQKQNILAEALSDSYNIVKHSSQLAIKKTRNIIKLHGSLPESDNDPFAFDNEIDKRYIISSEDYENYPTKHEAFTQLMRISLLQGCFCLIGFSGDDPNFLAWISWVRTIVMRKTNTVNEDIKIYLIDVLAKQPANDHIQQFYKNHSIVHIPLSNVKCIEHLEHATSRKINPDNTPEILNAFLDYLSNIPIIDKPRIYYELMARDKYQQLISSITSLQKPSTKKFNNSIYKSYNELETLYRFNRVPALGYGNSMSNLEFLQRLDSLLEKLEDKSISTNFLGVITLIMNASFVPYSTLISEQTFNRLVSISKKRNIEIYYEFLKQDLRDAIWKGDKNRCQRIHQTCQKASITKYQNEKSTLLCIEAAVGFRFSEIKANSEEAIMSNNYTIALAGYSSIFNPQIGVSYLKQKKYDIIHEQFYALEMTAILGGIKEDKDISEKQKMLEQEGLRPMYQNVSHVVSFVKQKPEQVTPYESDKFTETLSVFKSPISNYYSYQLIGLMLETGMPFNINHVSFVSRESAYAIFKHVLIQFPLPILYSAFQYSEGKFIKRLSEDYLYNIHQEEEKHQIFNTLSNSYWDSSTPKNYKKNILVFLADFILGIESCIWMHFFLTVWNEMKNNKTLFNPDQEDFDFILNSIRYCTDHTILEDIVEDCIDSALNNKLDRNKSITFLYNYANNPFRKEINSINLNSTTRKKIDILINSIERHPDILFILGNIDNLLNKNQKNEIRRKLNTFPYSKIEASNLWSVIVFYAGSNKSVHKKIIKGIIASDLLFKTGINKNKDGQTTWTPSNQFVNLRRLRKGINKSSGLEFTKTDVLLIYKKLIQRVSEVSSVRKDLIDDLYPVLQEMRWFLEKETKTLSRQPGFQTIFNQVLSFSNHRTSSIYISELLGSNDTSDINKALSQISQDIYDNQKFEYHEDNIRLLISKVQLKKGPGIITCLEYLVAWSRDFTHLPFIKSFGTSLLNLLNSYYGSYPNNLSRPLLEKLLIKLAKFLRDGGYETEQSLLFLELLNKSQFISIRNNLKKKLNEVNFDD